MTNVFFSCSDFSRAYLNQSKQGGNHGAKTVGRATLPTTLNDQSHAVVVHVSQALQRETATAYSHTHNPCSDKGRWRIQRVYIRQSASRRHQATLLMVPPKRTPPHCFKTLGASPPGFDRESRATCAAPAFGITCTHRCLRHKI